MTIKGMQALGNVCVNSRGQVVPVATSKSKRARELRAKADAEERATKRRKLQAKLARLRRVFDHAAGDLYELYRVGRFITDTKRAIADLEVAA